MAQLDIRQIPVLNDNYVYLVREPEQNAVGVVDPAVVEPIMAEKFGNKKTDGLYNCRPRT